jgi:biopolymer transport protein ExbB
MMVQSGASWVLWCLVALSVGSVAIGLERAFALRSQNSDLTLLVPELRKLLRAGEWARAHQLLSSPATSVTNVVAAGLADADRGAGASQEAMSAALGLERKRLEKRLLFLGTVGNNAPFIGLLGTVIGVVGAFEELGKPQAVVSSALAPERVMATIGEALIATAVGLLVAIPAVLAFNYFQARVSALLAAAETLGHVLLAHLKAETSEVSTGRHRRLREERPSPGSAAE